MPRFFEPDLRCFCALFCFSLFSIFQLTGQTTDSVLHSTQADIYLLQADSIFERGLTDKAFLLVKQAQEAYKEVKNWEGYVKCFLKFANLFEAPEDIEKRRKHLDQMIFAAEEYLPAGHKYLVEGLRSKGEYLIDIGQLDSARFFLSKAIETGKKSQEWKELAWALIVKGVVDYYQEDFVEMGTSIDSAQLIAETKIADPTDHFETITQLQAILFDATGDYEKAFLAAQKTLERGRTKPLKTKDDSIHLANTYNTQGAIYYERGDYNQAIHHYKIALGLHQKLKSDRPTLIGINNNISISFKRKTDWKQSQFYLEASKLLLPEKPTENNFQDWIRTHQLLASNFVDQQKTEAAITLLEKIWPISKSYSFNENWHYKTMGTALLKNGQPEKARKYFRLSLKEMQNIYGLQHPNIAALNRLIGKTYFDQNQFDSALDYFQKAMLALSVDFKDTIGFSNPTLENVVALTEFLPVLESKAVALVHLSKEDVRWKTLALKTFRLAISTIDKMRENYETEKAKLLLSTSAKRIYEESIRFLYQLYAQNKDQNLFNEAFQYAEKSKSLLLLEMIRSSKARQKINPRYAGDTLFYNHLEKGKGIKTELLFFEQKLAEAQQTKLDSENPKVKNAETALARLYQQNLEWKTKMKKLYPAYYDLQYDQSFADCNIVQEKLLQKETLFLEYFIGQKSSFLFVVNAEEIQFLQILDPDKLEKAHQNFQRFLLDKDALNRDAKLAYTNYNKTAFELYKVILKEVLDSQTQPISKLIIVPDGILNKLPFEALNTRLESTLGIDFGKLPYLLYDVEVHYGYSATLLLSNQNRYEEVPANRYCLALAPPYAEQEVLGKGSLKNLRSNSVPLTGTVEEIRNIAQYFPGQYNISSSATESSFKEHAADFGILHLAMHGLADFDNANFAYLKFTNLITDSLEDNRLHHYEIANMNFNAQLITLSACETGLGKYEEGEGVFSLARSFMYAGVPSVVMSLWKIDDRSTGQLMPMFYKNLAEGLGKDVALQMAKKSFLKTADLEEKHPYFWSGMVLLGDEQALKKKANRTWWYLGGFVFLLGVLFFLRRCFI